MAYFQNPCMKIGWFCMKFLKLDPGTGNPGPYRGRIYMAGRRGTEGDCGEDVARAGKIRSP
jgi:hypothetical protein